MPQKIRIGLIGTSWWADAMLLPAIISHPQADLVAICGRNQIRARELADKYQIPQIFADYRQMIGQAGLQAVCIVTPDDLHYEMAMTALNAGLHVLCEKPLAFNAQQAREMAEKAQAVGVKHMVLYTYRWIPVFQYLHDLVCQGFTGRIYHCEYSYMMEYASAPEYQWVFDSKRSTGVLGNLGSHMIDMARWMVGDITSVSARLGVFVGHPGVGGEVLEPANDSALLLVEFNNGAHGVIQASAVAHIAERGMFQQVKLYGEAGTLELDFPWEPVAQPILLGARSHEKQFSTLVMPESYRVDYKPSDPWSWSIFRSQPVGARLFIEAILADRTVSPNFLDGFKNQQVIDAAMESHTSGKSVTIADSMDVLDS
jgi:predicted dehydrogenase